MVVLHALTCNENQLNSDIKTFIETELENLKKNEFDAIQDYQAFRAWLLSKILKYISDNEDEAYGSIDDYQDPLIFPSINDSRSFNLLASNDDFIPLSSSLQEAVHFEYEQGFESVVGYPRAIVTETLRKFQLESNIGNIASLLPINIDTSFQHFDIQILIDRTIDRTDRTDR